MEYWVPQFIILENKSIAIVQNKNGITELVDKKIIDFFIKLDCLNKNRITDLFIKEHFKDSSFEEIETFLIDSKLIEKVQRYSTFNKVNVFTNNKYFCNMFKALEIEKKEQISVNYVPIFQSKDFLKEIQSIKNDELILSVLSPLDFNEYTWICDILRKKEKMYCMGFPYDNKFYFSNIYNYVWKNACPKCFISSLISSLRAKSKLYEMPTFQTVIDLIYSQDLEMKVYDFSNMQTNLEIIKSILYFSNNQDMNFLTSVYTQIDNGRPFYDQSVHWELCDCLE